MPDESTDDIKHRHTVNAADAREQASEGGYGFLRSEFRRAEPTAEHPDGELFEIPHKDLLDPDQQERWEDLQDEMRSYEREPDIPPVYALDRDGNSVLIARGAAGALVFPHRKDGARVRPTYSERLGIVLWGDEGAARAKAGGINFNEIEIVWAKQRIAMGGRLMADPKSRGRDSGLAAVPDTDRG